jgi:hypothetical protein
MIEYVPSACSSAVRFNLLPFSYNLFYVPKQKSANEASLPKGRKTVRLRFPPETRYTQMRHEAPLLGSLEVTTAALESSIVTSSDFCACSDIPETFAPSAFRDPQTAPARYDPSPGRMSACDFRNSVRVQPLNKVSLLEYYIF